MSLRRKPILLLFALLAGSAFAGGVAAAQGDESLPAEAHGVPRGPEVGFCPTREQTEVHAEVYGFDYKPTVPCDSDDVVPPAGGSPDLDDQPAQERMAAQDELLKSATPLPNLDGDPTTIEGELPGDKRVSILVHTQRPELYRGMNLDEFVRSESQGK